MQTSVITSTDNELPHADNRADSMGNEDNQEMPAQGMDRALLEWHGKIGL